MFDDSPHSLDRGSEILVLPDSHDLPALTSQCSISQTIPLDVPPQLGSPVPLVPCGLATVHRADMPEATIDEDGDLTPGKDDVRANPDTDGKIKPVIFAVAVTQPVQLTAKSNFRLRV
jgi:hypothetical protein